MPTRVQGRVDTGRRELGARVQNYHQPSADREGETAPETNTPASILLTISIPPPVTLAIGATYQTTATVYNAVGNVIPGVAPSGWQTSNTSIATVDGNGLVRGIAAGTIDITATLSGVTSNALSITVVGALPDTTPASVTVSPTTLALQSGAPQTLSAVIQNAAGTALALSPTSWVSSNIAVATVSNLGVVTWVAAGSTSITARYNAIVSNACAVTAAAVVDVVASSVTVSPTTLSLATGAPQTLSAVIKNAAGTALALSPTSWTSSDPTKATVNSSGVVTWVAAGTTTVRALYNAITSNGCVVTALVDANTVAASVVVTPATLTLQVSAPQTLNAAIKNSSGVALALTPTSWTSSNTGVATVNSSGVVTWVAAGTTNVAAHYNALDSNNCVVTATANPSVAVSITVAPTTLSLQSGAPQTLTATIKNANGTALALSPTSWTSSDTGKATVNSSGVVTWVAAGTTNVAAHYNALDSNNCVVTAVAVSNVPASILIAPSTASIQAGQTQQLTALVKNAAGSVLAGVSPSGWSSATPATCTVSATGLVTGIAAGGPINVTGTLNALTSNACAVTVTSAPATTTVDLPVVTLDDTDVADTLTGGSTIHVASGGNLQTALDTAVPGDTITLEAGAVWTGNYTINPRGGGISGRWIIVKTDGSLPAEHTRMTPALASSNNLPKIRPTYGGTPAIDIPSNAAKFRFMGIEITVNSSVPSMNTIVNLGGANTTLNAFPSDLIFDRCYVHGHSTLECRRGITLNSYRTAIIDSTVMDIHSTGFDTQAVWGWNGPGVYKVENNYLEASTEVIGFGGADPIYAGHNPTDIQIRRNHITRPMSYKGGPWLIKNMIELKCGVRVDIDSNVIENIWPSAQSGWVGVFWSVNQSGTNPTVETAHITFRNNVVRNCAAGFQITDGYHSNNSAFVAMHHVAIYNNTFIGMANPAVDGSGALGLYIGTAVANVSFEHNTFMFPPAATSGCEILVADGTTCANLSIRNNIMGGGAYPFYTLSPSWAVLTSGSSAFTGNVFGFTDMAYYASVKALPGGNSYPTTPDAVGLVGGGSAAYSVTATLAGLTLSGGSAFKNAATDGTDPGADQAAVATAVSGVGGGF